MNANPIDPMNAEILIVDDIPDNLNLLCQTLESEGYNIIAAPSGEIALQIVARIQPDLILLDIMMPGMDGFETCRRFKADKRLANIPVIFITARDETESVVEGFQVGGVDYITKPFQKEEVLVRVQTHLKNHLLTQELIQKNRELEQEIAKRKQAEVARNQAEDARQAADEKLSLISQREAERWGIAGFVGQSQTIGKILGDIRRLQTTGTTSVLITGESGTGKELIARAIHFGGTREKGPFIPVNCSAIPEDLAESLFFGHIRGAFTGATTDRKGYFELADGGTLFLDEIGEMPLQLQVKLLRVLEDGNFVPLGGSSEKRVDVRILAATNADLQAKIAEGDFREDLYFRLAAFTVPVPPLRERPADIPLLVNHFLKMFATEMAIEIPVLSDEALSTLKTYAFPGNVRELKNIIERALIESGGGEIRSEHLHFTHLRESAAASPSPTDSIEVNHANHVLPSAIRVPLLSLPLNLQQAEAILIQQALEQTNGNISEAARLLGIGRQTLYRKLSEAKSR